MHITSDTSNTAPRFHVAQNVARMTMTSREIAELTGRRHDQVLRTARELVEQGVTQSVETPYIHEQNGQEYPEHLLSKRDSLVLVARLSPEFTARIVDRWQELEAMQAPALALPNFANPAEAARAWAEQFEQRETAVLALTIAAPKAEFVDRYVEATGSMGFRQVAKLLKAKEHQLREMLISKGVMYYLGGTLTPHSSHLDAGRFEIKTGTSDRNSHAYAQARFTAKGVQWIAGLWASYQMENKA